MPNKFEILLQMFIGWFGPGDLIFVILDKTYARETMFTLEIVAKFHFKYQANLNELTSDDFSEGK